MNYKRFPLIKQEYEDIQFIQYTDKEFQIKVAGKVTWKGEDEKQALDAFLEEVKPRIPMGDFAKLGEAMNEFVDTIKKAFEPAIETIMNAVDWERLNKSMEVLAENLRGSDEYRIMFENEYTLAELKHIYHHACATYAKELSFDEFVQVMMHDAEPQKSKYSLTFNFDSQEDLDQFEKDMKKGKISFDNKPENGKK